MRRIGIGGAVLAIGLLALSGCTADPDDPPQPTNTEFGQLYTQSVDWGQCGEDFGVNGDLTAYLKAQGRSLDDITCAMIEAPLDWESPDNRETIELAVMHVPATGPEKRGTLFGNPGGPGASGIDYVLGMMGTPSFAPILEQYDLIGFDPRGIGRSAPLRCDVESTIREVQLAVCAQHSPLARTMGTSQVARDMDLLRALQGERRLDYLGYSYGTILGATYATLFPERVGRMVLDSSIDSRWASPSGSFAQAFAISDQLASLFRECGALYPVEVCPLTTEDDILSMTQRLNETPLVATDGTQVNGEMLIGYATNSLYGRDAGRVIALENIGGALAGEQQQIDDIAKAMAGGGAAIDLSGLIVTCHSMPDDPDIVGLLAEIDSRGMPKLLGGPQITDETIAPFADVSCGALPGAGDDLEAFKGPVNTTILIIGITGDHATPFESGKNLAKELGNTRFLTLEGHGHGASYTGKSTCIDDATTAFLLDGDLPPDGTVCQSD
ncbi:alpha/beta hydrolase [Microbacterium sp. BWT-B31]|uniref:alpha/beta hydrolase n=1 Tax=Microbacterium sp. BWT-B31 TaxID=3232072 RepID=UPI003529932B